MLLENLNVIYANASAQQLLVRHPVIQLENGTLRLRREVEMKALQNLMQTLARAGSSDMHCHPLVLRSRQSQPIMLLTFQSLGCKMPGLLTVLRIVDLQGGASIDLEWLRAVFGLTRAEARVAAALLVDRSVVSIATRLNLGPETVRSHLKRLMAKHGVKSQAELVRVMHSVLQAGAVRFHDDHLA